MNSSMPTSAGVSARRNKGIRNVQAFGLLLVAVLVGLQFVLPWYTGRQIGQMIRSEWELESQPSVTVSAFPFYKIWQGKFDELVLRGESAVFSDILVDNWEMRMQNVTVSALDDQTQGMSFNTGTGFVVISESALEDYLIAHANRIANPKVVIHEEYILYSGQWNSGIIRVSFSATGYPYTNENGEVCLELERITVGPFDIPGMVREITESFLLNCFEDQQEFIFSEMRIAEIMLGEGSMRIELIK